MVQPCREQLEFGKHFSCSGTTLLILAYRILHTTDYFQDCFTWMMIQLHIQTMNLTQIHSHLIQLLSKPAVLDLNHRCKHSNHPPSLHSTTQMRLSHLVGSFCMWTWAFMKTQRSSTSWSWLSSPPTLEQVWGEWRGNSGSLPTVHHEPQSCSQHCYHVTCRHCM